VKLRLEVSVMCMYNSKCICNCVWLMLEVSVMCMFNTECVDLVRGFSYIFVL
jgi:hypothetical protein